MDVIMDRAFAFDIDGTLLGPGERRFGTSALRALTLAHEHGDTILASARPFRGIINLYDIKDIHTNYIVALNGGLIIRDNKPFRTSPIDQTVVDYFMKNSALFDNLWLFTDTQWYSSDLESEVYVNERASVCLDALALNRYNHEPVLKITIATKIGAKHVVEHLGGVTDEIEVALSCDTYLEINAKGTNKYTACRNLYSSNVQLFSFGDSGNDIAMLTNSYFSCVPSNAITQAKDSAKYASTLGYSEGTLDGMNHILSKFNLFKS